MSNATELTQQPSADSASMELPRPNSFQFDIASGMLESLGLNMYTSIGKSLSEFVANVFDADAENVWITIPFADIDTERAKLRERAKAEVVAGTREKFTVLSDSLPEQITIQIRDDGHGMLAWEIQQKLLVINRNRRGTTAKSDSGKREVMGRKGLGKLAGFGTAECVRIWSKRAGVTYATEFIMDYAMIKKQQKVHQSNFEAKYYEELPIEQHGTLITLSGLRCDSLKASQDTVEDTLSMNFSLYGEEFKIHLNNGQVLEVPAQYEYIYPEKRDADGFGTSEVMVSDMFSFPITYAVRFRARETDNDGDNGGITPKDAKGRELVRGPLPTLRRGARIYCHGRLSAGPTLLKLQTGMHNFHSQAYMECIVHADEIDRQTLDFVGTNRADLKGNSDVVEALQDAVTELMRLALYEHSKFRDIKVVKQVEQDPLTKGLLQRIEGLPKNIQSATKKLLHTLASTQGVKSDLYKTAAPLVLQGMNAGEVLSNLIRLETDPKSLEVVTHELLELSRVENTDALKLYRGRRSGIEAVRSLVEDARKNWKKGARFENKLHQTLKENPWLLGPEFNRCLTSDRPLSDVARELSAELAVDQFAPAQELNENGEILNENDRPDLVFLTIDSTLPSVVTIVELKTPNYPLRMEHYDQLDSYRFRVEAWLTAKYAGRKIDVRCLLIGDLDDKPQALNVRRLNELASKPVGTNSITILPLRMVLENAKRVHLDAIEIAEKQDDFYDDELSTDRSPISVPEVKQVDL